MGFLLVPMIRHMIDESTICHRTRPRSNLFLPETPGTDHNEMTIEV